MPCYPHVDEQAALRQLIAAAQALAAHHLADLAARPEPVPEYFDRAPLGLRANCLMVPVPLLNGLARAVTAYKQARNAPAAKRGVPDSQCEYLYWPDRRCDKCGRMHDGRLPGVAQAVVAGAPAATKPLAASGLDC